MYSIISPVVLLLPNIAKRVRPFFRSLKQLMGSENPEANSSGHVEARTTVSDRKRESCREPDNRSGPTGTSACWRKEPPGRDKIAPQRRQSILPAY